ncbi:class II glutamine amidotransferase [Micromonosporaceae bacterium Da 78-11]
MCRLFGLSAAPARITATFWLAEAPDSLTAQSHREPDGVGLGYFAPDGTAVLHKQPIAAYQDAAFAQDAREASSSTFLAHIRYATTGALRTENTHPFLQDGRLFAHNGVVAGLDRLDDKISQELGAPAAELVKGDTDSERVFALITAGVRHHSDVRRGIVDAIGWIAENLPVYALNLILTTPTDLFALRYPATNPLYVLSRPAGGTTGTQQLDHRGRVGTIRARSEDLTGAPATIVATERMDDAAAWRALAPGELLHVSDGQHLTSQVVFGRPPAHPLSIDDLRGLPAPPR